jgi:hypothetical protein
MLRTVVVVFLLIHGVSAIALGAPAIDAKVQATGTYGSGQLFVMVDTTIEEPGCELARFDVAPGHPEIDRWLGIALAAEASGKRVRIKTNGCHGPYPTLDTTNNSWFYIKE